MFWQKKLACMFTTSDYQCHHFRHYSTRVDQQSLVLVDCQKVIYTNSSNNNSLSNHRFILEFITGLEKEFASTANTVTRTVGKLMPSSNVDYGRRCALCQM
jgi:hypothetical protein